jgi:serine/threonine protein kinase/WD40 repeat protein
MSIHPKTCPNCGGALPPNAPSGHCPACLLRIGLAVADGGLANGLEETARRDSRNEAGDPTSALPRIRYVGDYELLEEIGRGGMGIVYRARQVSLNRPVALKLIRAGELANEKEVARFLAEAEAAASLDHPNIVPIYEVGEHEARHYFGMKLIDGGALSERISNLKSPMSDREAATLLATVARAVHYAHQRGILHRDLKPGNILHDAQGEPYVTDFGLAKRIEADSAMTLSGAILGTPGYIAPEQAAGAKQLTTAADVYSLGAILYELLAGRPPFVGETVMDTLQKVIHEEPAPPSAVRSRRRKAVVTGKPPGYPSLLPSAATMDRDFETICLKCLEKDPARRYGSAEALADDLDRWLAHKPILARPATPAERFGKWTRRNPMLTISLVVIFLVALAGLTGVFWQWREAVTARRATQEELWHSQLLDARSYRLGGEPGRRAEALAVLARAAAYRPSVELRNESLATLVLPDLGSNVWWRGDQGPAPRAFTSDLKFFTRRSDNGQVLVFREADAAPVARLPGLGSDGKAMRFSRDDSLLAVKFANGALRVWRWREQQLLLEIQSWRDDSELPAFDFTPDGREFWLSDAQERLARYSLSEGQPLPVPEITNRVRRLSIDPAGDKIAGWAGRTLGIWDATNASCLGEWQAPGEIWCLDWHPSGRALAFACFLKGVHLAEIGQTNLFFFAADADVNAVFTKMSFTPNGNLLLAGGHGSLFSVWNHGTRQQEMRGRGNWFWQLSRDGTRLASFTENVGFGVREFHPPVGIERRRVPTVLGAEVSAAAWHPEGRWLVTGHPRGWVVWDARGGPPVRQREGTTVIASIQFLPDGSGFLTGGGAGARLWPFAVEEGQPRVGREKSLTSTSPHERAALSPDGKRFAAVGKSAWLGWTDGRAAPVPIADGNFNTEVKFSPDGRWLCLGEFKDSVIKIRDAFTGGFVTNLPAGTPSGRFTLAGDQLISSATNRVTFWQTGTWKKLREAPLGSQTARTDLIGFWPDGSCALVNQEGTLRLWNLNANTEIAALWLPIESHAWSVAFDSSAQRMATTASRPYVDLWDLNALRRELACLGLDWPGDSPSTGFAPRR